MKTVLFVTYGGGHARMVVPVVRALQNDPDIRCEVLALTVGGTIFKSEGLPYKGYKDFITPDDKEAIAWGKKLAAIHHKPESGIEEEEAIAYLGLSYWDIVQRHGEAEAARLWQTKERHAFLQVSVLERVIDQVKPDLVVTTNSPKSEHAAVIAAKKRDITTLSMVDLFAVQHFYTMESDYIAVLSEFTIDNLLKDGVKTPRDHFFVTGNPAFDPAFDYRGPIDYTWRREHFPALPDGAKTLLWTDMPAYWNLQTHDLYMRDEAELLADLDMINRAAKANNAWLLVRPHPSQQRSFFDAWIKRTAEPHILYAGGVPLYPLLKAIDLLVTYTCTTAFEAVLMQRRLIQLDKRCAGGSDMPMAEWGMAWKAQGPQDLPDVVRRAYTNETEWQQIKQRMVSILSQEKAGPQVAARIRQLLKL